MPEMKKHALFVDLQNVSDWSQKVRNELLLQVDKFFEEWHGKAPDPSTFVATADRIMCVRCSEVLAPDPHIFSRPACELKLQAKRAEMNVMNEKTRIAESDEQDYAEMLQETCNQGHIQPLTDILSRNVIITGCAVPFLRTERTRAAFLLHPTRVSSLLQ